MSSGVILSLAGVNKKYPDGFHAVKDVSFDVTRGETLCLLGTSGCGKTTLLKMINRLIEPSSGEIFINGKNYLDWNEISLRRNIGYVIQSIGLFPHFTIYDNIAIVPRLKKWKEKDIESRIEDLMRMVNLPPEQYRDRYPSELSGGQQQRIGVIRAIAADPEIILMDEPFGALDPITRAQIQDEFLELKKNLSKTILMVTHDLGEAIKLGDRIAVIDKGRVLQLDTPRAIISHPSHEFVRDFFALREHYPRLSDLKAAEIALPAPPGYSTSADTIGESEPASEAIARFLGSGLKEMAVCDEKGQITGILSNEAIVRVFKDGDLLERNHE